MEIVIQQQFRSESNFSLKGNTLSSSKVDAQSQSYEKENQPTQLLQNGALSWPPETQKNSDQNIESQESRLNTYNNNGKSINLNTETTSLAIEEDQLVIVYKDPEGEVINTIPPTHYGNQSDFISSAHNAGARVDMFV
ncbi:MAG: hypothetical protein Q8L85_02075 [Alphaproteobacteria bacterium]|jgi:hypothetical protein|nr:hypothetical protein [Alphaproteobacteria bacterium]